MHIYLLILNYVDFHLKSIQEGEKKSDQRTHEWKKSKPNPIPN